MKDRFRLYHRFLKFKGIYALAWKSALRLIAIATIITVILILAQLFINNLYDKIEIFLKTWDTAATLVVFLISETLLGLIPPEFFIVWANNTSLPIIMLNILAVISYVGGVGSFFIGRWVRHFPKINNWLEKRFSEHFDKIKKYGAFLIVFSALFPLPFSTVSMVAGMVNYPTKPFLLFGLSRLFRFYLYAIILFQVF
jgi:membrane protein YqaA with SNARE-associated domain